MKSSLDEDVFAKVLHTSLNHYDRSELIVTNKSHQIHILSFFSTCCGYGAQCSVNISTRRVFRRGAYRQVRRKPLYTCGTELWQSAIYVAGIKLGMGDV